MVSNFEGDLDVFKKPENKIKVNTNSPLVTALKTDSLIEVLYLMKSKRISLIPIEDEARYTVGLLFLNDVLFLLRLPHFWEYLGRPVESLLREMYGDEDQNLSQEIEASLNRTDAEQSEHFILESTNTGHLSSTNMPNFNPPQRLPVPPLGGEI